MIFPIVAYGDAVLKKVAIEIDKNYPGLQKLIDDMFETMYHANGVGLAAPQVGKSIRLFVVDASPFAEDEENKADTTLKDFKRVFINAKIVEEQGDEWSFNEGCLSIPKIRESVYRKPKLRLQYFDEGFNFKDETFEGLTARIIQHEYDHIEGKLFIDRINPLRKRLLKGKLNDIINGQVEVDYRMKFTTRKR